MTQIRTCPRCEKACSLQIDFQGNELLAVNGHRCPVGIEFAESLFGPPHKIVSVSVSVKGGVYPSVMARTARKIPPDKSMEVIREANRLVVEAPIRTGQVLARNVAGTGSELIAVRDVERA